MRSLGRRRPADGEKRCALREARRASQARMQWFAVLGGSFLLACVLLPWI